MTQANATGVCYPRGFRAAGITAGLKASGLPDLALVENRGSYVTSATVTTTNRMCAAPVRHLRQQSRRSSLTHVILNSGNANAATGQRGYQHVLDTVEALVQATGAERGQIAVCSTGVIGQLMDIERLTNAIPTLVESLSETAGQDAACAICTTDTRPKTYSAEISAQGRTWRVGGMVKGAGMLAPAMATMLCVITTDAHISAHLAQTALEKAVARTFNRTDTDGCMSTNDTVILLSSGESGCAPSAGQFETALENACTDLAGQLVADAEGAHHRLNIEVVGAHSEDGAEAVARAVARSNLVKTAIFGGDPNWGRILSEVGTVPASIASYEPEQVDISINGIQLCAEGTLIEPAPSVQLAGPLSVSRATTGVGQARREEPGQSGNQETSPGADRETTATSSPENEPTIPLVTVTIDLHAGPHAATIYTTDLTYDYVTINSEYTT